MHRQGLGFGLRASRFSGTKVHEDKSEQERVIAGGYPRWEIVRPGRLTNGTMTGHYRVLDALVEGMRVSAISRSDVAHFMGAQAEHPT